MRDRSSTSSSCRGSSSSSNCSRFFYDASRGACRHSAAANWWNQSCYDDNQTLQESNHASFGTIARPSIASVDQILVVVVGAARIVVQSSCLI